MPALHILFISSWYPNRNNAAHGIFNREFARAAALRASVSILHVSADHRVKSGIELQTFDDDGIFTVQAYYAAAKRLPFFLGKIMQHFRRLSAYKKGYNIIRERKGKPDILQLNVVWPAGPGAAMLSRRNQIPLVVNECWTGYDPLDGRYRGVVMKKVTGQVIAQARKVMPVTAYMQQLLLEHGLRSDFRVIPNVVDTEVFKPEVRVTKSVFTLIHVSALDDAQKNVTGILTAFQAAAGQVAQLRLVIAGDGPDGPALRVKAVELGLQDIVRFAGQLKPADLNREFNDADALVMFSNYESFCVAVPEALACGKPVITSNAGGIMSYFNDQLGIVVPAGDVNALTAAMVEITNRQGGYDRQFLRDFVVERFSRQVIGEQLNSVYNEVMERS